MTSKPWTCALLAAAACALVARPAPAGVPVEHDDTGAPSDDYAWNDAHLQSGIGVAVTLGGGIAGFTDHTLRDTTSPVGGLWDLRAAFGTHAPIAVELGYIGTATQIQSLFGVSSAMLIGTTLEGDVRLNLLPHYVLDPYAFVGVGWQRYDVDEHGFSLASTGIANQDDVVEVPVGGGVSYRFDGLVADVRGTFRATRGSNLVLEEPAVPTAAPTATRFAPMHSWEASLSLGYEF
ncbi:MAG: hypothetical protein ACM31C_15505 [Acidobacteriota bacterium]